MNFSGFDVDELRNIVNVANGQIDIIEKSEELLCDVCGGSLPIGDLTVVVKKDYVEPHGCTGGDYWTESGIMFFVCDHCGHFNNTRKHTRMDQSPKQDREVTRFNFIQKRIHLVKLKLTLCSSEPLSLDEIVKRQNNL